MNDRQGEGVSHRRTDSELFEVIRAHLSVHDLGRAIGESEGVVAELFDHIQTLLGEVHNKRMKSIVMYTDGAARGNPGPAGAGVVIENCSGEALAVISEFLGERTNNMAEYQALLLGMRRAVELGATSVLVRSDSELLVQQIRGLYRVRNRNLLDLYNSCTSLIEHFHEFTIEHIDRKKNKRADTLANNAIDSAKNK